VAVVRGDGRVSWRGFDVDRRHREGQRRRPRLGG
jgi:hypothetical protein